MTAQYELARRDFTQGRPEHYNFARDVVDRLARERPGQRAMLWVDDHGNEHDLDFKHFSERSARVANMLAAAGVRRGDSVMVLLTRQVAWWEVVTACLKMGAVAAPGTTQLSAKDIAYRVGAAGAVCVVTDSSCADKVDTVAGECESLRSRVLVGGEREGWTDYDGASASASAAFTPVDTAADDDALCYFTSGTTGYPKMCIHNQLYALGHETTGRYWLDLSADDLHWNISDTGWAKAAWSSYFAPWLRGAALFVHHTAGFDPAASLAMFGRYPITSFCGAPTVYRLFVQQPLASYRFDTLRSCVGAGEPLNPEVIERWRQATGLTIRDGYGQTETTLLCGNMLDIVPRPGSMGKPSPGIDLAVIDEAGYVVAPDIEGDIAVRVKPVPPLGLFKEYRGQPEKTAACVRGDWYITGDRARRDGEGYFWFVSRADDVILSAGYRIGPFEVESALLEHPAVIESAVVASPDPDRGEVVKAFIVLAAGYEPGPVLEQEIKDHVKQVTAPYKYPRKIAFVKDLPKTVSGKIRRVELRDAEWRE